MVKLLESKIQVNGYLKIQALFNVVSLDHFLLILYLFAAKNIYYILKGKIFFVI